MEDDIGKAERAFVARARHAFTRLGGLEFGDKLADELWESRNARRKTPPPDTTSAP